MDSRETQDYNGQIMNQSSQILKEIEEESAKWRSVPMSDTEKLMLEQSWQDSGTMERFLKLLGKLDDEYTKFNSDIYKKQARLMLANRCIGQDFIGDLK